MKKSKILVVGLIGLLMAGGLVLIGCDQGCSRDGDCYYNSGNGSYTSCQDSKCAAVKAYNSTNAGTSSSAPCDC